MNASTSLLGNRVAGLVLGVSLIVAGCTQKQSKPIATGETAAQLLRFVAEKKDQAERSTETNGGVMRPEYKPIFDAAEKLDWLTLSNRFEALRMRAPQFGGSSKPDMTLVGPPWNAVLEVWGAFKEFDGAGEKFAAAYGNDIVQSIPPGSIYFGGTDPGRFLVTALSKSHVRGKPFFTLAQNQLSEKNYLDYLHFLLGGKIYIATPDDLDRAFTESEGGVTQNRGGNLVLGAQASNNRVWIGSHSTLDLGGRMTKVIFDNNPTREFFVEESFPLGWMYPHEMPFGIIMKVNRNPLPSLSEDILQKDHEFWSKYSERLIGNWVTYDTPVNEIVAWAEKVYLRHDLTNYAGGPDFVFSRHAQMMFSKLRSSIAGVYQWRLSSQALTKEGDFRPKTTAEYDRLMKETDFAFRQAFAFCPYSPEAVFRYVNLLLQQNRFDDALLVAQTCVKLDPNNSQAVDLVERLKEFILEMEKSRIERFQQKSP